MQVLVVLTCLLVAGTFADESALKPQYYNSRNAYNFAYEVKDPGTRNHYGHKASSDGEAVIGYYHVLLPDGRVQTVTYKADKSGYKAVVEYQGQANYYKAKTTYPTTLGQTQNAVVAPKELPPSPSYSVKPKTADYPDKLAVQKVTVKPYPPKADNYYPTTTTYKPPVFHEVDSIAETIKQKVSNYQAETENYRVAQESYQPKTKNLPTAAQKHEVYAKYPESSSYSKSSAAKLTVPAIPDKTLVVYEAKPETYPVPKTYETKVANPAENSYEKFQKYDAPATTEYKLKQTNYSPAPSYTTVAPKVVTTFKPTTAYPATTAYPTTTIKYPTTTTYPATKTYSTTKAIPTTTAYPASTTTTTYPTITNYPATKTYPTTKPNPATVYPANNYPTTKGYPAISYPTTKTYPGTVYPDTAYPATVYPTTKPNPATAYPATKSNPATTYHATVYLTTKPNPATAYPGTVYPTTKPNLAPAYPATKLYPNIKAYPATAYPATAYPIGKPNPATNYPATKVHPAPAYPATAAVYPGVPKAVYPANQKAATPKWTQTPVFGARIPKTNVAAQTTKY